MKRLKKEALHGGFLLFFQQNIGDAPVFGVQIPVLPQPGAQGQPPAGLLVEDAELLPGQKAQLLLPQPGAAGSAQPPAFALLVVMFALPLGAMAQTKFAHMNSQEVIITMPEYTKAQADLDAMSKEYQTEMQRTQEEFNKKYQEFLAQADSLPKNIAERRQKELQDMAQRQEQFQQEAYQSMQKAQQDAMTPIYKKLDEAIQAVGKAEGVVYIFDLARTPIPYVGTQSIDVTAKVKTQLGIK